MDAIAILNDCQRRHEAARPKSRGLFGIGGGSAQVKLDHGTWTEMLGKIHDRLFADGTVTWAGLVMANNALLAPGKRDLPGVVVYSLDGAFDASPEVLVQIATRCFAVKDTTPADPRLKEFAREISDETAREMNMLVPTVWTGGKPIRIETIYVQRHRLPTGYLTDRVLPVIVHPKRPTQVMMLPLEFWSPALFERWRKLAKRNPVIESPPPLPTDDALREFAQNPVTLTPAALAEVRQIIRAQQLDPREVKLRVEYHHGEYGLDLTEEAVNPDTDLLYDFEGVSIVIDQTSAAQLAGVVVDFSTRGGARGFVFNKRDR